MKRILSIAIYLFSVFLLCGVMTIQTPAAPGDLDLSFGNGGILTTPITNAPYYDSPSSVRVQPDGKIVVGGQIIGFDSYGDEYVASYFLARYNLTGALDSSFGINGKVIGPFDANEEGVGDEIALQPDGKILAIGRTRNGATLSIAVHRYNPNGTLDASFGFGGKMVTPVEGSFSIGQSIAIQPDGKIVVAGYTYLPNLQTFAFAVVRLQANGFVDTSFGTGGAVITLIGTSYVWVGRVLVQPDGKIIVVGGAGSGNNLFTLVRYNPGGSLDSTFGTNGKVQHSIFGPAAFNEGLLQPDGKIVAIGRSNNNSAIVRYNANGSLDTTFAQNGVFLTEPTFVIQGSIVLQPDGKLVAFGYKDNGKFAIARLKANGMPDDQFGINGRIETPIGTNAFSWAVDGAVQSDGKILAFGVTYPTDASDDIAIIRYLGDSAPRRSAFDFDGDNKTDLSIFRPAPGEWWWNKSSNGGNAALQFGTSTDRIAPADFTGDGTTDIAFFRPSTGQWFVLRSEDFSFYAFPFGTNGDVPVPADYDADGKADAAVFRPSTLTWFIAKSSGGTDIIGFGSAGDVPTVADYDGDGKADIAIYRPNAAGGAQWWVRRSSNGSVFALVFGTPTDRTVQGDYTGDGKADIAFWRPSTGGWFVLRSEDFSYYAFPFGTNGDTPVPGDYDGDGKTDAGVFRQPGAQWFVNRSSGGTLIQQFGIAGDIPLPSAYVR